MLESFLGNNATKEVILNMLKSGHLPHAIMLEGDEGLGKHTLATELVKAILCEESTEYCGLCRNCTLLSAGTHPDYSLLSPNSNNLIRVDDIRALRKKTFERPDRSQKKVYLIEKADRMNREAQNAFLKILEEPPEYVVFILLAESSSVFLDTVISRCTVFRLNAPSYSEACGLLKKQFPNTDDAQIDEALLSADNNIGRAIMQLKDEASAELVRTAAELLVLISGRRAYECLKLLHKFERDPVGLHNLLATLSSCASLELRKLSLGKASRHTLSRGELINIIDSVNAANMFLKQNVSTPIVLARFCSSLIK